MSKVQTNINSAVSPSNQFLQLVISPRLRISTLVFLLGGLVFGTLSIFVALFMRESGISSNAGWFFTTAGIANIVMRLVIGRVSDRYGRGLPITLGLVLYGLSVSMLSVAQSSPIFFIRRLITFWFINLSNAQQR